MGTKKRDVLKFSTFIRRRNSNKTKTVKSNNQIQTHNPKTEGGGGELTITAEFVTVRVQLHVKGTKKKNKSVCLNHKQPERLMLLYLCNCQKVKLALCYEVRELFVPEKIRN